MERIYLDHAATTPVDARVAEVMSESLREFWGNPSSVHGEGRRARKQVEEARAHVARLIGANEEEIFFTSGGTEADNLAIFGTAGRWLEEHDRGLIITTPLEHHAVLHACEHLERHFPVEVRFLDVDREGIVQTGSVAGQQTKDVFLLSVMLANNEIGTIQPLRELADLAHRNGWLIHTDAVQAAGQMDIDVGELGVDLLALSSHKIYGPKGVGALYVRKGTRLFSIFQGGAQERRLRPGTENVPGIAGFGYAAKLALAELSSRRDHLLNIRDAFWRGLKAAFPEARLNGAERERLPNNLNIRFPGVAGEQMLLRLDLAGIAASSGSACTAGGIDPSHVLLAIGQSPEEAQSAVRFSFGKDNSLEEISRAVAIIADVATALKQKSLERMEKRR